MNPFSVTPPDWIAQAGHARRFECSRCGAPASQAQAVWINRRAPVYTNSHQRKWQEFYYCQCGYVWWAWSSDRPPSLFGQQSPADGLNPPNADDYH